MDSRNEATRRARERVERERKRITKVTKVKFPKRDQKNKDFATMMLLMTSAKMFIMASWRQIQ